LLPLVLAGVLLALSADARIYKYVDRLGEAHYTDSLQQVPREYRNQVRDISDELKEMGSFRVVEGLNGDAPGAANDPVAGLASDLAERFGDVDALDGGGEVVAGLLSSLGFGVILLALLAIPVLYVVSALVFKLSCRLAGEDPPGLGRACVVLLAQGFAGGAVGTAVGGVATLMGVDDSASIGVGLAVGGASMMLSWMINAAILTSMMGYAFLKSMWIGFLHTLLVIVMIGGPIGLIALIGFALA
jgi:hypothetical protein